MSNEAVPIKVKNAEGTKARLLRMSVSNPETGCREWQGSVKRGGYGKLIYTNHKTVSAHRLSYTVFVGPIPTGLFVCHRCDNRKCIEPTHLFLGTHEENTSDMMRKGRYRSASKLSAQQVAIIKAKLLLGVTHRALGIEYGVRSSTISMISSGANWRGVPAAPQGDAKP